MKHLYLTLASVLITGLSFGQIVWQSNFDTWTNTHAPTGWLGTKTNIETDSVLQITSGATFGNNLAQLTNVIGPHRRFTTAGIPLTEGNTYEVEVWVKGTGQIRTGLFDNDLDGGDYGFGYNAYQSINSASVISFVQTISPDTTYALCELILSTIEGSIQVDRVEIRLGDAVEPVAKTIYEIQYTTATDGVSPESGTYVITSGVVTAVATDGYWIQNGTGSWNGIRVFDAFNTPSQGDNISVTGTVEEYFSYTRINNVSEVVTNGTAALPAVTVVGTGDLNNEQYEGVLVRTFGTCTAGLNTYNEWFLSDGSGDIMANDEMFMFTPSVGTQYYVTGPLNYSFFIFKIEPRNSGDVSLTIGLNELKDITAKMYPNPTSDLLTIEHSETGKVMAQLFDLQGRLVLQSNLNSQREIISLNGLTEGVYTLVLSNESARSASLVTVVH